MNRSTLLEWLSLCSLVLLITSCTGDDLSNTNAQNTGANTNTQHYLCMAPAFPPSGFTLTLDNTSGPIHIVLDGGDGYTLLLQPTADPENGTFSWTPSGHAATLVLTPSTGDVVRNVNYLIKNSMEGTYTSDSLGQGSFTFDSPLSDGCGPYCCGPY
jgi:hypothetical protein